MYRVDTWIKDGNNTVHTAIVNTNGKTVLEPVQYYDLINATYNLVTVIQNILNHKETYAQLK